MYYNKQRPIDEKHEKIVEQFLMKYFYKKIYNNVESIFDQDRQVKGIDIIADELIIDNKAQCSARYINNPTNTFAVEIVTYNKQGDEMTGWFINNSLLTKYYAFVWIHEAKTNAQNCLNNYNDIEKIEVMIVDKQALHDEVNKYKTDEDLYELAVKIRDMGQTSNYPYSLRNIGHLSCSQHLREKPVNLVINKAIHKKFAIKHCFVTKDEIIDI